MQLLLRNTLAVLAGRDIGGAINLANTVGLGARVHDPRLTASGCATGVRDA